MVDGQRLIAHQGSAMFFPPLPGTFLAEFYNSIGIDVWQFPYQTWSGRDPEIPLGRTSYTDGGKTSGFFFGAKFGQSPGLWLTDPWGKKLEGAPISERARRDLLGMRTQDATRPRKLPERHGDAISRHLDSITLEQHLMDTYGLSRETVRTFLSPVAGGGSGLGADALSAYAEYAADVLLPWDYAKGRADVSGRKRGRRAAHRQSADPGCASRCCERSKECCRSAVNFSALDRTGPAVAHSGSCHRHLRPARGSARKPRSSSRWSTRRTASYTSVRARSVIMAGGSWTTKHIVKRPAGGSSRCLRAVLSRAVLDGQCRRAQLAVPVQARHQRVPVVRGHRKLHGCAQDGHFRSAFSYRIARFSGGAHAQDSVLRRQAFPSDEQVTRGRAELLSTPFREYERRIREQFTMMFSSAGFDARRDIAGIILNRWGHAYLSAQPGFFFGSGGQPAPGEVLRNTPYGRIAFANSDLAGIMDHRASILEAHRAVGQLPELG